MFEYKETEHTSIIGGWPLTPILSLVLVMTTSRSRPLILLGTGTVTSTSLICCVHL